FHATFRDARARLRVRDATDPTNSQVLVGPVRSAPRPPESLISSDSLCGFRTFRAPCSAGMNSYGLALELHSIVRLALTLASLLLLVLGLQGWSGNRDWGVGSKMLLLFTMILADVQLLIGLGLYFAWSPTAAAARADYGAAMKDPTARFWAV